MIVAPRILEPGTSGWTADDLEDPDIESQWEAGRFEIINGVLKKMPAAYFDHGGVTFELLTIARGHCRGQGRTVFISTEADLVLSDDDVLHTDGMLMTREDVDRQRRATVQLGKPPRQVQRVRVAPLLVIESVSPGHERHDRVVKCGLYAGFGVPNYWVIDRLRESLDCLVLDGDDYRVEAAGRGDASVTTRSLGGTLTIPLPQLWDATFGDGED